MPLITTNPGIRVSEERRDRQFRSLCRAPKAGADDGSIEETDGSRESGQREEKPFGSMYNLFFWAVHLGATDGSSQPVGSPSVVPFRWNQIPAHVQNRLEALALRSLLQAPQAEKTEAEAQALLARTPEELSETLRVRLEELAERGLQLMEEEVELERPDAYTTVDNLVETILRKTPVAQSETTP